MREVGIICINNQWKVLLDNKVVYEITGNVTEVIKENESVIATVNDYIDYMIEDIGNIFNKKELDLLKELMTESWIDLVSM